MIISIKNIFKSCFYFTIIYIMFYNISYSADEMPYSIEKIKKETQIQQLPNVNFKNLNNKVINLNNVLNNNLLIINFWALWCAPCIKEMPALNKLSAHLSISDSKVLFVNQDGFKDLKKVEEFVDSLNIDRTNVLIDFDMQSNRNFQLRGIPTTLIINKQGIIKWRIEGVIDWTNKNLIDWLIEGAN